MLELSVNSLLILVVFILGYALITIEHIIKINKTTIAILMAVLCWAILYNDRICYHLGENCMQEHLSSVAQIVIFLLGALAIVEIINAHKGFKILSDYINVQSKLKLLWIMGAITFFLSSILDNLTTTIVMVTLLQKLLPKGNDRLLIGGAVVIAANAGGAWTPIGDVTTTMLWIGGQLSTLHMMRDLFVPSMVCMIASFAVLTPMLKGDFEPLENNNDDDKIEPYGKTIFFLGAGALVFIPIFKVLTGLPQFMGVLFGFSVLWLVTDLLHPNNKTLRMPHALARIDWSSILFFLGILLCVDALDKANILGSAALWLDSNIGNQTIIATVIGFLSAVVDNVPLVAASMRMYDMIQYPIDSRFWELIAYCAGTGGSMLIIGSAAGVVFMGLEHVDFFWYLKRISFAALVGYLAGIGTYLLLGFHG